MNKNFFLNAGLIRQIAVVVSHSWQENSEGNIIHSNKKKIGNGFQNISKIYLWKYVNIKHIGI